MSDDRFYAAYMALMLILPISALAARRLPVGNTVKMALAWFAIFGLVFVLVVLWQSVGGTGALFGGASR